MGIFDKLFGPPNVEELKSKKDVEGLIKALKYVKASELKYMKDIDVRENMTCQGKFFLIFGYEPYNQ